MKIAKVVFLDSVEDPRIVRGSSLDKSRSTFVADATLQIDLANDHYTLLSSEGVTLVPASQARFAVPAFEPEPLTVQEKRGPGRPRKDAA